MENPLIIAFGSQISGRNTSSSDFDFGVFTGKPISLDERVELSEHIAQKFDINEDKIDLVDLSTASPILKFEVAKKGRLISGDNFDFIRFKVLALKEYENTRKFRRFREKVMLKTHV